MILQGKLFRRTVAFSFFRDGMYKIGPVMPLFFNKGESPGEGIDVMSIDRSEVPKAKAFIEHFRGKQVFNALSDSGDP